MQLMMMTMVEEEEKDWTMVKRALVMLFGLLLQLLLKMTTGALTYNDTERRRKEGPWFSAPSQPGQTMRPVSPKAWGTAQIQQTKGVQQHRPIKEFDCDGEGGRFPDFLLTDNFFALLLTTKITPPTHPHACTHNTHTHTHAGTHARSHALSVKPTHLVFTKTLKAK